MWLGIVCCLFYFILRFFKIIYYTQSGYFRRASLLREKELTFPRHPPKPGWVRKEVIRLKALMPHAGCRTIAHTFNRLYAVKRLMTVGKTYVSYTIQKHQYEIQVLRRKLKHQRPRPVPKHLIWGVDLTYFTDECGQQQPVLGIVEHHSRACLKLDVLRTKASIILLQGLFNAIQLLGVKPKILRTDNEAVFTSLLFRFGLWLMGIKHQRTEVCCPWQNGRVERFFGTLKAKSNDLVFVTGDILQQELNTFRFWYNHIRPHHYLNGLTPVEAYHGCNSHSRKNQMKPYWFEDWNGRLMGFWFPRE